MEGLLVKESGEQDGVEKQKGVLKNSEDRQAFFFHLSFSFKNMSRHILIKGPYGSAHMQVKVVCHDPSAPLSTLRYSWSPLEHRCSPIQLPYAPFRFLCSLETKTKDFVQFLSSQRSIAGKAGEVVGYSGRIQSDGSERQYTASLYAEHLGR